MNKAKRKQLEQRGWKFGSASEFLGLSAEESRFIELKLVLSRWLREWREALKLTQVELGRQLRRRLDEEFERMKHGMAKAFAKVSVEEGAALVDEAVRKARKQKWTRK